MHLRGLMSYILHNHVVCYDLPVSLFLCVCDINVIITAAAVDLGPQRLSNISGKPSHIN